LSAKPTGIVCHDVETSRQRALGLGERSFAQAGVVGIADGYGCMSRSGNGALARVGLGISGASRKRGGSRIRWRKMAPYSLVHHLQEAALSGFLMRKGIRYGK
jgi:hypothetical protein